VRDLKKESSDEKRMTWILGDRAVKDRLDERCKARSREVVQFVGWKPKVLKLNGRYSTAKHRLTIRMS
jgi:hypothetical protein